MPLTLLTTINSHQTSVHCPQHSPLSRLCLSIISFLLTLSSVLSPHPSVSTVSVSLLLSSVYSSISLSLSPLSYCFCPHSLSSTSVNTTVHFLCLVLYTCTLTSPTPPVLSPRPLLPQSTYLVLCPLYFTSVH
uniref:Uncharacterized protein n=1 Tax=Knipowitschia caucasica TaxID=637954 RepID=A0AAV2M2J8_KNICA